ncbi:MAG: basic amino acid/polyamine antiporter, family [Mycobacterium sp.]|jgi:amino acid transporter|nr:basic amino acid/polyamine antiporter, family [Mycobacterium sp.]
MVHSPVSSGSTPTVFVRNATGLRKEAGALDVFVYNTNNQNIGLGVAFLGLAIGSYAGGLLPLSAVLASLLVVPLYMVYGQLSADMPRSGGDYVWTSRIFGQRFGPPIGFVLAWTWIVLAITAIGAPAAFFSQLGVSGWMRAMGAATGSATFGKIGDWVSSQTGTIVVGAVLLAAFTLVMIRGVKTYMKIQNWAFVFAMAGIVLQIVASLLSSVDKFPALFDAYVVRAGGVQRAYDLVVANASSSGAAGGTASATMYAMVWTVYMVLFGATSAYIGGEVRRARSSQRIGMLGSLILTGGAIAILLSLLISRIGDNFLNGLSATDPADLGLAFLPNYNELLTIGAGGNLFWALALGFLFLFWTYVWMPINFFTATRLMLALSLDGYLPASLSKVHPKYATPYIGILVAGAVGAVSMVLYVIGILSVITLLWAGVLMFAVVGVAAVLYPSRMPEVWAGNGGKRFAGVPTIRLWGILLIPAMLFVLFLLWNDPVIGIGHAPLQMALNLGLPITGLILYAVIWGVRKRSGIDLRLASAEIPPE